MFTVYLAFLAFGVFLALGSLVLGQVGGDHDSGGGADADAGGGAEASVDSGAAGDASHAGGHAGGHATAHADSHAHVGGAVSFPFFSPAVLGSFSAAFGAGGIIALESGATSAAINVPVALGSGVGLAYVAGWLMMKFLKFGESSTAVRTGELMGTECDVTLEIPAGGVGEVVVVAGGVRSNYPARAEDGGGIPRGARVTVANKVGATLYVTAVQAIEAAAVVQQEREKLETPAVATLEEKKGEAQVETSVKEEEHAKR